MDKACPPGWAFLTAQKPSPCLCLDLPTEWQLCTEKKQSLIQQCNLNPNTAKSYIRCENTLQWGIRKIAISLKGPELWFVWSVCQVRGKRQVGGKARGKTCQPLIHFFHWYMYGRLNRDLNNSKCLDCQSSIISLQAQGRSTIECTVPYGRLIAQSTYIIKQRWGFSFSGRALFNDGAEVSSSVPVPYFYMDKPVYMSGCIMIWEVLMCRAVWRLVNAVICCQQTCGPK